MIRALLHFLRWAFGLLASLLHLVLGFVWRAHAVVLTNLTASHSDINHTLVEHQVRRQ